VFVLSRWSRIKMLPEAAFVPRESKQHNSLRSLYAKFAHLTTAFSV
jgi:hypothetical protein